MTFYVYVLYSQSLNRYYTGLSQYHAKRYRQHVRGQGYWTGRANDWEEVWVENVPTRQEARSVERRIKRRGAERFLQEMCRGPA